MHLCQNDKNTTFCYFLHKTSILSSWIVWFLKIAIFLPLHLPLNKTQLRYSRGRTPNFSRKRVSTRASRMSENCPTDLGKSREKRKICIQAVHARESIFLNFHEIRAILRQLTSGRRHISLCYVDICLLRVVVSYPNTLHCQNSIPKVPMLANSIQKYNSSNKKKNTLDFHSFKILHGFSMPLNLIVWRREKISRICRLLSFHFREKITSY